MSRSIEKLSTNGAVSVTTARVNTRLRGDDVGRRPLASSADVAEYLGVPQRTLDQWVWRGKGPKFSKVGKHRRYRWSDVENWLDEQAKAAA